MIVLKALTAELKKSNQLKHVTNQLHEKSIEHMKETNRLLDHVVDETMQVKESVKNLSGRLP